MEKNIVDLLRGARKITISSERNIILPSPLGSTKLAIQP